MNTYTESGIYRYYDWKIETIQKRERLIHSQQESNRRKKNQNDQQH